MAGFDGDPTLERPFFGGVAGSGMGALAQYLALGGGAVAGSDRSFDQGREPEKRRCFGNLGITIHPQDGTGPAAARATCLVVSTAVEEGNPEILAARGLGIPVLHRSELLARLAAARRTVAVSGTSGKSTVAGMAFHVLEAGGLGPGLITGANLESLRGRGLLGNAFRGAGAWLVIEADESDGSLVRYRPELGVILNVDKDHQEVADLLPLFATFLAQSRRAVLNADDPHCRALARPGDAFFSSEGAGGMALGHIQTGAWESSFSLGGEGFHVPVPGRHNIANALAAIAIGLAAGADLAACARGLAAYRGVERRHVRVGARGGITVVDDFAHNPAKIQACLTACKQGMAAEGARGRLLAIFHPHGFGPMKLLRHDIAAVVVDTLGARDAFFLPEIYYAGGTADRALSARDMVEEINAKARRPLARFAPDKEDLIRQVADQARPGDWIVSMGARDPVLGDFARRLFAALPEE